ncbi:MAG: hypothetical protein H3C45_09660 [Bacteroidia bacterium]|nr:hypothetical protein [Bacteroidia bacterium]
MEALNKLFIVLIGGILITSCNTKHAVLNQVEDDVYFSKKQNTTKDVYVPEVDVNEIMRKNPPQYGNENKNDYLDNSQINPNAEEGYRRYLEKNAKTQEQENSNTIITTPQQNYSNHNNTDYDYPHYTNNYYFNSDYSPYYRNNYYPTNNLYVGWNSFTGIGFGLSFGYPYYSRYYSRFYQPYYYWDRYSNFCDPFYYRYWNYNPFYYNHWHNPFVWGGYLGWNYRHPYYYYPKSAYSDNKVNNKKVYAPRNEIGSTMPRANNNNQPHVPNGNTTPQQPMITPGRGNMPRTMRNETMQSANETPEQYRTNAPHTIEPNKPNVRGNTPATQQPDANSGEVNVPRTYTRPSQGQLVEQNGQNIYVAPEKYRGEVPRSYDTYTPSVKQNERYREVVPQAQPRQEMPAYRVDKERITRPANTAPESFSRPSRSTEQQSTPNIRSGLGSFGGGSNSGGFSNGGGRSGGSSGSSGGGRVSMPRTR